MYTLEEIASQIEVELDGQSNKSEVFILYLLRQKVGELNVLLGTNYTIDGTDGSIDPDFDDRATAILKCLFYIYYFEDKIRSTLNAASFEPVTSISENGQTITILNKNESSKIWATQKREQIEMLDKLVNMYKLTGGSFTDVTGKDTDEGTYPD